MISTRVSKDDVRTSFAPALTKKRHASDTMDGHVRITGYSFAATKLCGDTRDLEFGYYPLLPKTITDISQSSSIYNLSRIVAYALSLNMRKASNEKERFRFLRDRALIVTLADTNLEVGMICNLRKGNIDWKCNQFRWLDKVKTRATISFTPRVKETLRDYLNARLQLDKVSSPSQGSLPVFASHGISQGNRILLLSPRAVQKIVAQRASQALGAEYDGTITAKSFRHYSALSLLDPLTSLHPKIVEECQANFEIGRYDNAVFNAMKVIEEEVRLRISGDPLDLGMKLMANSMNNPVLIKFSSVESEQQAAFFLFSGAIGFFKNPQSHRFIEIADPVKAFEYLALASMLIRMLDEADYSHVQKKK